MTTLDDKNTCEMVETVKDRSEPDSFDITDDVEFRRHSKSLVRKLDMTLMPTVSLSWRGHAFVASNGLQIWFLYMFNYLDRNNIR